MLNEREATRKSLNPLQPGGKAGDGTTCWGSLSLGTPPSHTGHPKHPNQPHISAPGSHLNEPPPPGTCRLLRTSQTTPHLCCGVASDQQPMEERNLFVTVIIVSPSADPWQYNDCNHRVRVCLPESIAVLGLEEGVWGWEMVGRAGTRFVGLGADA
mgnify:CR=1 FL=1